MVVISFFAQKGGSGKSTMTRFLANYLAYTEKKNVVVIDGDAPQFQIYKLREANVASVSEKVSEMQRVQDVPPYQIFRGVSDPAKENREEGIFSIVSLIDALSAQDIDYLFVDLAGTLNSPTLVEILSRVNYIFVPFMEAPDLFSSNMEALFLLSLITKNGEHQIKGIYEFWHKYRGQMSQRRFDEMNVQFGAYNDLFREYGLKADVMKTKVGNSVVSCCDEMLYNTVIAPPKKYTSMSPLGLNLGNYIKEFMAVIKG